MQAQTNIEFDQLVNMVKKLPATQWSKLKQEVEKDILQDPKDKDMETFLLSAPTFTKKQLDAIAKTRKAINQWRTK